VYSNANISHAVVQSTQTRAGLIWLLDWLFIHYSLCLITGY
jgi:hypothetical protein